MASKIDRIRNEINLIEEALRDLPVVSAEFTRLVEDKDYAAAGKVAKRMERLKVLTSRAEDLPRLRKILKRYEQVDAERNAPLSQSPFAALAGLRLGRGKQKLGDAVVRDRHGRFGPAAALTRKG